MGAFQYAVDLGYQYLETDVHATADGVLVAFHDSVLDRVTDRQGAIAELPWSEVSQARVDGEPIPLFGELLASWSDVRINVDAKADSSVDPLISTLFRARAFDRACIAAFSTPRMRRIRRLTGNRICTATAPSEIARVLAAGWRVPPGPLAASCAQVPVVHGRVQIVGERFLAAAHRLGIAVHVWTVDEESEMDRLLDLGVDGIMTDRPALLKQVMQRRGIWP